MHQHVCTSDFRLSASFYHFSVSKLEQMFISAAWSGTRHGWMSHAPSCESIHSTSVLWQRCEITAHGHQVRGICVFCHVHTQSCTVIFSTLFISHSKDIFYGCDRRSWGSLIGKTCFQHVPPMFINSEFLSCYLPMLILSPAVKVFLIFLALRCFSIPDVLKK